MRNRPLLMTLSLGRSVSACKRAYALINAVARPPVALPPPVLSDQLSPAARSKKKRPAPTISSSAPTDQAIHAQSFASVNAPGDLIGYQTTPALEHTMVEPPSKKRGRPNKEEHERRVREAAQRGEVYPPPKKAKTPRQSLESGVRGLSIPGMTEEGSTSKKRVKKSKGDSTSGYLAAEIPARTSSLEATAIAADQMRIETEQAIKSTIPETQASDFPARESLLAGMREHAAMTAQEEPDTVQSSSTLKHDSVSRSGGETQAETANLPTTTK